MEFGVHHIIGLKVISTTEDNLFKLTAKSSSENIYCGILQGSTLGPLLFLLYVNDLPNCVDNLSVLSFVDDTNLFYSSDNLKQLESVMNRQLKQIYNYCALNKLSINTAKTSYMLVSSSRCYPKINITGIEQKDYLSLIHI